MLRIFLWKILRLWISDVWLPCVATLLWQLTPCVGPAEAEGRSQTRPVEFLGVYFFILVFMTIRALNFILLFVPQLVQHN